MDRPDSNYFKAPTKDLKQDIVEKLVKTNPNIAYMKFLHDEEQIDHLESKLAEIAEIMDYCLECFGSQYLPLHDKLIEAKALAKGK